MTEPNTNIPGNSAASAQPIEVIPPRKVPGRPFAPGNPGRKPGTRNKVTVMLEKVMAGKAKAVTDKVVAEALAGNMVAAKMLLDRIVPPPRDRKVAISLPPINSPADLLDAHNALIGHLADGTISAAEAAAIASVMDRHKGAVDLSKVIDRMVGIEDALREIQGDVAKLREGIEE
jgi:hypothetical protein